jgi:hypothetical protein
MFTVSGGIYTDTTFSRLESDPEEYGPFASYKAAYTVWKSKMGWKVDICCHRLFIHSC